MKHVLYFCLLALIPACGTTSLSNPQNQSSHIVNGKTDPNTVELVVQAENEVLFGATVQINDKDEKFIQGVITDANGHALINPISELRGKNLNIQISYIGYLTYRVPLDQLSGRKATVYLAIDPDHQHKTRFDVIPKYFQKNLEGKDGETL